VAPDIDGSRSLTEVSVKARRPVKMQCDVSGIPPPEVTWTKDGAAVSETRRRRLLRDGRVLVLAAALVDDAGLYVCTAQNVAGVERKRFQLHVLGTSVTVL